MNTRRRLTMSEKIMVALLATLTGLAIVAGAMAPQADTVAKQSEADRIACVDTRPGPAVPCAERS